MLDLCWTLNINFSSDLVWNAQLQNGWFYEKFFVTKNNSMETRCTSISVSFTFTKTSLEHRPIGWSFDSCPFSRRRQRISETNECETVFYLWEWVSQECPVSSVMSPCYRWDKKIWRGSFRCSVWCAARTPSAVDDVGNKVEENVRRMCSVDDKLHTSRSEFSNGQWRSIFHDLLHLSHQMKLCTDSGNSLSIVFTIQSELTICAAKKKKKKNVQDTYVLCFSQLTLVSEFRVCWQRGNKYFQSSRLISEQTVTFWRFCSPVSSSESFCRGPDVFRTSRHTKTHIWADNVAWTMAVCILWKWLFVISLVSRKAILLHKTWRLACPLQPEVILFTSVVQSNLQEETRTSSQNVPAKKTHPERRAERFVSSSSQGTCKNS